MKTANNKCVNILLAGPRLQTEKEASKLSDEIVRKQVIDENHPIVMELVNDLKFDLHESLEAVKHFDTIQLCVTYLSKDKEETGQLPSQKVEQMYITHR